MQAGNRYIKFRAAGVLQHQEFAGFAFNGNGFQALVAANAMIYMNHRCANAQLGQVPVASIVGLGWFLPTPPLQHPFTEEGCFRDQSEVMVRQ